jgi:pimeloyl-ACP methyl ester carboxylesterase
MRASDIRALGGIGGDALATTGRLVRDAHEGIAGRPFGILGAPAAPVRVIHEGVSKAVYAGVLGGLRAGAQAAGALAAAAGNEADPELRGTRPGATALGVLNGLWGNHLAEREDPLAATMDIRRHGRNVGCSVDELATAFPDATPRIAVFVHGLMGDDECWRIFPLRGRHAGRRTYGERLQEDLGYTPVHIRYNTGLRVSDNGRALAALLDQLSWRWPVAVEEITLFGHSMGGLVARSACREAEANDLPWTDHVRHVFCLGSPHLGADAEKGLNALGHLLGRLPEGRGVARILNARSVGIKDMRYGSCAEADWQGHDPDEYLRDRCTEVPFLPAANYYFVGTTFLPGPLGSMLGDLLVRMPSASGRGTGSGRRIPFEVDNGHELSGLHHMDLLNHPAVYAQLRAWLTREPVAAAA